MQPKNKQPTIYEINTATFLRNLSDQHSTDVTFATVPDEVWDELASMAIDTIWFMGVWKRSDFARDLARTQEWIQEALPGATHKDILGSAYSIADYSVDELFGGNEGLAVARQQLHNRGIQLMLDYVPNHVAIDHPWTIDHPEYFVRGSQQQYLHDPESYAEVGQTIFAKAKDPNFPVWSDVLQLNAFSEGLRQATINTLNMVAEMCDAVRCDMAMLLMNDVFQKTWGKQAGKRPRDEFWTVVIDAVRSQHPDFYFLAEAYWNKEALLLQQGFDLCYDKKIYDYLIEGKSSDIRHHLQTQEKINSKLLRFIENHDEERVAHILDWDRHRAAAVVMATLPGAHLYHDGQLEGYRRRVPVQLSRRYAEPLNQDIQEFYLGLMDIIKDSSLTKGAWQQLQVHSGFLQHTDMLAWSWVGDTGSYIVLVNFSGKQNQSVLDLPYQTKGTSTEHIFGTVNIELKGKKAILHASSWAYGIIKIND